MSLWVEAGLCPCRDWPYTKGVTVLDLEGIYSLPAAKGFKPRSAERVLCVLSWTSPGEGWTAPCGLGPTLWRLCPCLPTGFPCCQGTCSAQGELHVRIIICSWYPFSPAACLFRVVSAGAVSDFRYLEFHSCLPAGLCSESEALPHVSHI